MTTHPKDIKKAVKAIFSGFLWAESPEGIDYWREVVDALADKIGMKGKADELA
jgi:hypothetical protein